MPDFKEVLYICDDGDSPSSVHCYDVKLGIRLLSHKGGHGVARRSLNLSGGEFLITAEASKPFLHVWGLTKEEQVKRIPMPGKVTAFALSENGFFSAGAIDKKLYIWNMATGQLLNVVSYHHEPITKIIYWKSNYFISCGGDGLVAVWRMVDVVSKETGDNFHSGCINYSIPFYSSSRHSLPVTDMFLASSGNTSRLFTVSADQTCQIFSLDANTGNNLLTLTYDYVLTSVTTDRLQKNLFVGTNCGKIIICPAEPCSGGGNIRHVGDEIALDGHAGAVGVLSLSMEDNVLASGSDDKKVILWNLLTRQQMCFYQMSGSVTDLLFSFVESDFPARDSAPRGTVSNLERATVAESENIEVRVTTGEDEPRGSRSLPTLDNSSSRRRIREELNYFSVAENILEDGGGEEGLSCCRGGEGSEARAGESVGGIGGTVGGGNEEEDREESVKASKYVPFMDYATLRNLKREISELKIMNRRLQKANKNLYLFAMEQILQYRCLRSGK